MSNPSASGGEAFSPNGGVTLAPEKFATFLTNCSIGPAVTTLPPGDGPIAGAQTPAPTLSWKAVRPSFAGRPPDAQIAVSSSHVIVGFNRAVAVYDRVGTPVGCIQSTDLFSPLGLETDRSFPHPVTYYDDVRLVFDEYRKRFCILSSGGADKSVVPDYWFNRSVQVLAVCVSQNPLDGWYLYWWDAAVGYTAGTPPAGSIYRNSDAPDYPNLGVSPGLVVATARISTPCTTPAPGRGPAYPCSKYNRASPDHPYWHAVFLDGEHLSEGRPGNWVAGWHFWDITSPDGGSRHLLQPAVHHGPSDATWLVSAEDSPSKFAVFRLTDALTAQQKLDSTEVALNTASYRRLAPRTLRNSVERPVR